MDASHSTGDLVRKAPGYAVKLVRRWAVRRYRAAYFRRNPDHRAFDRERAVGLLCDADSVLCLCWGNVCRSPLAGRYLRERLDERGFGDVTVESAGLGSAQGRTSPANAVRAASQYGVDLSDHESQRATASLVADSDVVFVMDYNNFHSVNRQFEGLGGKVVFLGTFARDTDEDVIPDPYGSGPERFERTYRTITDAVDEVVAAMAEQC